MSALLCKDGSGNPVSVNAQFASFLTQKSPAVNVPDQYRGLLTTAGAHIHNISWCDLTLDIPNSVAAAQYVHGLTAEQRQAINPLMTMDPGDAREPYVWNNNGTNYLLVRLAVPKGETPVITDDNIDLLIDSIAIGNAE